MSILSRTPIPDEEYRIALDEIYLEIGKAIADWYLVEERLNEVHALAVLPMGIYQANLSASFHAVTSFGTRLSMVTAAMENAHIIQFAKQPYEIRRKEWRSIRKKLLNYNALRNKVAHGAALSPVQFRGEPYAPPVWVPFFESYAFTFDERYPEMTLRKQSKDGSQEISKFEKLYPVDIANIRSKFNNAVSLIDNFIVVHAGKSSD